MVIQMNVCVAVMVCLVGQCLVTSSGKYILPGEVTVYIPSCGILY